MKIALGIFAAALAFLMIFFVMATGTVNAKLQTTVTTPDRFSVVSETYLGMNKGYITIIKDNVTGMCMASHLYQGVMSWRVPCDQQDMNKMMLQQMLEQQGSDILGSNVGGQ